MVFWKFSLMDGSGIPLTSMVGNGRAELRLTGLILKDGMLTVARFTFSGEIAIGDTVTFTGFNALIETPVESFICNEYPPF